ncbi:YfbU family protein, partial [Vibrio parahaemolyticus]|nr:YfbU family protein [Vibrio parahaemolyticus]
KYSGIPFESQETPQIVKEVLNILDMWSFIERSYASLTDENKAYVEREASPFGRDPKFPGFDGNNETDYMGAASFLVNDLDRFAEFKGRDFNSHCPSVDGYQRMMNVYKPIMKANGYQLLTAVELVQILLERIHPSMRKGV